MVHPQFPLHLAQVLASGPAGYIAYLTITRTQTYEESTKKAAVVSNTAEHHLWKTRYTLGGGTVGIIASLLSSVYLISTPDEKWKTEAALSLAIAVGLTTAYNYIASYWQHSIKVPAPGMKDYNDAITSTHTLNKFLGGLAISWYVAALWYGVKGFDRLFGSDDL